MSETIAIANNAHNSTKNEAKPNKQDEGEAEAEAEAEAERPQAKEEQEAELIEHDGVIISDYIEDSLKIIEETNNDKEEKRELPTPKTKKSVSFNPNDEKIRKFTTGEPIVDQQNPFKNGGLVGVGAKKTPPPVPTKRSTLSVRKTVTQQLREREREKEKEKDKEREKEKEKEKEKNELNARKKQANKAVTPTTDDYITTEEVLKQSKYVKTYIKNPDPYFVYDPTVLARLKFEELRDIAGNVRLPKRKQIPHRENKHQPQLQKQTQPEANLSKPKTIPFKKCSKPNYPELANLKIRTGFANDTTNANGGNANGSNEDYFNPAEVTKNAKKFDERVKKLQISSDDDLDDIDGPLTKSESSDELNQPSPKFEMSSSPKLNSPQEAGQLAGTFTNTISSEEFQAYLERKGLALMPKTATSTTSTTPMTTPMTTPTPPTRTAFPMATAEQRRQQVAESLAALRKSNTKKLSVLQRLSNSLFASTRRKTTPKIYADADANKFNTPAQLRRILLEPPPQREREKEREQERESERERVKEVSNGRLKSHSDWLPNGGQRVKPKPTARSATLGNNWKPTMATEVATQAAAQPLPFQRTQERQSLIPRRVSPEQQVQRFQRSASMDRQQIRQVNQRPVASRLESVGQRRSLASASGSGYGLGSALGSGSGSGSGSAVTSEERISSYPIASSTPVRQPQEQQHEWEQLRAIKEVTDRQLYHKVLQQQLEQGQQRIPSPSQGQGQLPMQLQENIYERVQPHQLNPYLVRGSLQRNTFNGIGSGAGGRLRRQVMILDDTPIVVQPRPQPQQLSQPQAQPQAQQQPQPQSQPVRCQSVLDELITPHNPGMATAAAVRRGYESENETPVIMRRKDSAQPVTRRIGGLLTREELLEKVKDFCRKSINRAQAATPTATPTPTATNKMQPIYERQLHATQADISPVSYASVDTTNPKRGRPQVPLRVQSLPRGSFQPIGGSSSASPIYAHVNKRSSLLSNDSEQYLSSQQLLQVQQPQAQPQLEYVLIQTEEGLLQAAKLIDYPYVQPQAQLMRPPQGYVRIEELQHLQQNGRATPLILGQQQQQGSQIYWTPHHQQQQQQQQRLHHQLSLAKSPRQAAVAYPIPAPRQLHAGNYVVANGQTYATVVPAPRNLQQQQQLQLQRQQSDWDCSSEAGEVRRIMEKSF